MRTLLFILLILCAPISAQAEILIFKDGKTLNVKVIERDEKKMKVEHNGEQVTYYLDEIQSINGQPLVPPKTEAPKTAALSSAGSKPVSQPKESKRGLIKKFIDLVGTREAMSQNFDRMIAAAPPKQSQEIKKMLNVDEVIDNILPLYDKHFTQEELEAYIAFFSSPQGQKFLKVIPQIMKESVDVNIEYFKAKFPQEK